MCSMSDDFQRIVYLFVLLSRDLPIDVVRKAVETIENLTHL